MISTTLQLEESHLITLRQVALQLGYIQSRGPGAHSQGNISKLVRAIADLGNDPAFVEVLKQSSKDGNK